MSGTDGFTILERPDLESPVLVVMLNGWIDAGGAAAAAMSHLEDRGAARTIGTFDPDVFIDYRARRPVLELREGVSTSLVWPGTELKVGRDPEGRDVLFLSGHEPDSNWRRFADLTTGIAIELGVRMMVGLGAYPFATPHTRPSRLSCTTPSADLARSVGYLRNSVDVPAGVEAVLEHAFHDRGVPAIGLWVQVPHYVATMAYPSASASLIEGLDETGDLHFSAESMRHDAALLRHRLDELVAGNSDHVAMVQQLEQTYDVLGPQGPELDDGPFVTSAFDTGELPSGDELAAELERFLREQGD